VYNAKSDLINSAFDFAHKIIQPSTYNCNLCKLTHGGFREKRSWKDFRKNTEFNIIFYHINEFEEIYPKANSYPLVLKKNQDSLKEVFSTEDLNVIQDTEELIDLVKQKLLD
jgi:hypothetical protein